MPLLQAVLALLLTNSITADHCRIEYLPGYGPVHDEQYSGHVPVDPQSAMFYWLFLHPDHDKPVIIWLQGGPGESSIYGLFHENGPYNIDWQHKLSNKEYSWTGLGHLMFIDIPVGTGFSYTDRYRKTDTEIASDFIIFLQEFYRQYPALRSNPLFLTGESYAGKYILSIGNAILEWNDQNDGDTLDDARINFAGIAIGGSWMHPAAQIPAYSKFAQSMGLLDDVQTKHVQGEMQKVMDLIGNGSLIDSSNYWDKAAQLIYDYGGGFSPYDIRDFSGSSDEEPLPYQEWLRTPDVMDCLCVCGRNWSPDGGVAVFEALRGDDMISALEFLPKILNTSRALLFNGQFDWVVNHIGVHESLVNHLDWPGADDFRKSSRRVWRVNGSTAGFVRSHAGLSHAIVVNSGHMTPADQPLISYFMLKRFLENNDLQNDVLEEFITENTIEESI